MNILEKILQERLELSDDKIHVYLIQFNLFDSENCIQCLSEVERHRAERLKIDEKKNQFVITRSVLRFLLSSAISKTCQEIEFFYGEHGKPGINDCLNGKPIEFNISHSGNYALIAITLSNKLGVDIEEINPDIDHHSLSKRFFSKQENLELQGVSVEQRCDIFYRVWTRKESFIKATGKGVTFGLERFSVSLNEGSEAGLEVKTSVQLDNEYFTYNLMDVEGYKTALTTSARNSEIVIHT